jgi:hypothetical protein
MYNKTRQWRASKDNAQNVARVAKIQKELEHCTFSPTTSNTSSNYKTKSNGRPPSPSPSYLSPTSRITSSASNHVARQAKGRAEKERIHQAKSRESPSSQSPRGIKGGQQQQQQQQQQVVGRDDMILGMQAQIREMQAAMWQQQQQQQQQQQSSSPRKPAPTEDRLSKTAPFEGTFFEGGDDQTSSSSSPQNISPVLPPPPPPLFDGGDDQQSPLPPSSQSNEDSINDLLEEEGVDSSHHPLFDLLLAERVSHQSDREKFMGVIEMQQQAMASRDILASKSKERAVEVATAFADGIGRFEKRIITIEESHGSDLKVVTQRLDDLSQILKSKVEDDRREKEEADERMKALETKLDLCINMLVKLER